jgi:hypothetical protein
VGSTGGVNSRIARVGYRLVAGPHFRMTYPFRREGDRKQDERAMSPGRRGHGDAADHHRPRSHSLKTRLRRRLLQESDLVDVERVSNTALWRLLCSPRQPDFTALGCARACFLVTL